MSDVLYRMARRDNWTGKYRWAGLAVDQGAMQAMAHEIHMRINYSVIREDWVVLGATTGVRLDGMLERLNRGTSTCAARLERFLQGALDESTIKEWEENYLTQTYTHTFTVDDADITYIKEAITRSLNKVFGSQEDRKSTPPDPTTEEEEKPEEKPVKRWPKEVKRRLEFMRWLKERGVFKDDMYSAV